MGHKNSSPASDPVDPTLGYTHTHTCVVCARVYGCLQDPVRCKVMKAVKVNKSGPYCLLCYHLEMATRVATFRKMTLTFTLTEQKETQP
jgi:hypothetical protein